MQKNKIIFILLLSSLLISLSYSAFSDVKYFRHYDFDKNILSKEITDIHKNVFTYYKAYYNDIDRVEKIEYYRKKELQKDSFLFLYANGKLSKRKLIFYEKFRPPSGEYVFTEDGFLEQDGRFKTAYKLTRYTYEYDSQEKLSRRIYQKGINISEVDIYTYTENTIRVDHFQDDKEDGYTIFYKDDKGNITQEATFLQNQKYEYINNTYNEDNLLIKSEKFDRKNRLISSRKYKYNENNDLVENRYDEGGQNRYIRRYILDERGTVLRKEEYIETKTKEDYDAEVEIALVINGIWEYFDKYGNLKEVKQFEKAVPMQKWFYYDDNGILVKKEFYDNGYLIEYTLYDYNQFGLTKQELYDKDDNLKDYKYFTYDNSGNLIKYEYSINDTDYTQNTEYNDMNKAIQTQTFREDQLMSDTKYKYDRFGNVLNRIYHNRRTENVLEYRYFYEDGKQKKKEFIKNNELLGYSISEYNENGQIKGEMYYQNKHLVLLNILYEYQDNYNKEYRHFYDNFVRNRTEIYIDLELHETREYIYANNKRLISIKTYNSLYELQKVDSY